MKKKIIVIGLDGACWDRIGEWVENGELPNISRLKDEGCWGPLQSCIPPITCPAWKCYSTGKNPGKLGVFWWERLDLENRRVIRPNSNSFKSRDLWDYLNGAGYKTGIIGMPTTYPPKKVDGFMVSGGPHCDYSGYTYPSELEDWLKQKFDYKIHPSLSAGDRGAVDEVLNLIISNFEIAKTLIEKKPVDFIQVTTFHLNSPLQHYFGKGEPTKKAWELIDEKIGELIPDFDYLLIMSDHGNSPMIKNFFINAWLEKEGYLVRNKTLYDFLFEFGFNSDRISKLINKLHLTQFLRRFEIIQNIARQIPDQRGLLGDYAGESTFNRVNWQKTRVIGSPQGPLYINKEIMKNQDEYESLRAELINKLEGLKDIETNKNVIKKVYKREEIYHGRYVRQAPDLVALDADEYHNLGGIGKANILEKSEWQGNNARYGLFLFSGPGIRQGQHVDGVTIFDLAPTILHLMNVSIPEDMDGRVLKEIFKEDSELAKRKVTYQKVLTDGTEGEKERIKKAVRKLSAMNLKKSPFKSQKEYYDKNWDRELTRKRKYIFLRRLLGDSMANRYIKDFVISRIKKIKTTKSEQHTLKIIDMGCGLGWVTKILSEYGDVIGIDLSVGAARKLYPDLKFKQVNIITEEIEGKYDIGVSTEVLEHLTSENQQTYIKKVFDILKEGGYLILTTPNKRSDADEKSRKKYLKSSQQPIENWIDKKSLMSLLERHGFKIRFIGSGLFLPIFIRKYTLLNFAYERFYSILFPLDKFIFKSLESSNKGLKLMVVAQKLRA